MDVCLILGFCDEDSITHLQRESQRRSQHRRNNTAIRRRPLQRSIAENDPTKAPFRPSFQKLQQSRLTVRALREGLTAFLDHQ